MPRVIVLFSAGADSASSLADAAARGAGQVRFTEVEVRAAALHGDGSGKSHPPLESTESLTDYAGIVIAHAGAGMAPADLDRLLAGLEQLPGDAFQNTVFGVATSENPELLGRVARLGGIVVAEPRGVAGAEERARALGERVARVTGWVRHSLSHEHGHHHH